MKLIRGTMWTTIEFTHETENFQQEFEAGLKQFTGVRVDGYQFSPAYKRGVWDGYTHFYDEKLHRIPTGIANLAMEFVKRTQMRYPNLEIDVINEYPEAFIAPEDFPDEITFKDGDDTWPLRDYQYNSVKEGILNDTGIINLATNAGKCYVLSTSVLTNTGYKPFSKILEEQGVDASDTTEREIEAKLPMVNRYGDIELSEAITINGVRHVNTIKTDMGLTETVTDSHPMLVVTSDGTFDWVKSKDLKAGDYIVSRKGDNVFGRNDYVSVEEAYMLGYMLADGSISTQTQIQFTNDQDELLEFIYNFMVTRYPDKTPDKDRDKRNNSITIRVSSKSITADFHTHYDLPYVTAEGKEVPAYILDAPKEIQVAFLSAMFETEGSFNTTNKLGAELTSKSYDLAHNIQLMLLNMGVLAKLSTKKVKNYSDNVYYRLTLGSVETKKLFDLLEFKTSQRNLQHHDFDIAFDGRKYHNGSFDTIPYSKELLKSYRDSFSGGGKRKLLSVPHNMGKEYIKKALHGNIGGDSEIYQTIESLLDDSLFFNKVTAIEDSGEQPTFDLSMPETHSFIAEGLVNHNTGTSVGFIKTLYPYLERGEKIAYIVPSKAIFDQAVATMTNNFGEKAVGYMGDGKRRISDINVILMPSLVSGLKDPTNEVKLTGKNRANQLFVEEVLPVLDGRSNLRTMITNFLRNYRNAQKMTRAREEIVESLEYMLSQNLSDKQIQLQLNNEKVRFQKLMRSKVKDKYDKWEETKQLVADTKVVIVDEGHHSKADTYYNTLLQFENAQYRFAMSGSVDKSDKLTWRRLQALYGDEVYQVSNDEMIERGVSAKPYIRFLNIRKQVLVDNPKNYLEVYDKAIVKNEERNTYIADFTKSFYDTGKKILIIVNRVEHGELIMEMLEKRGVVAEFINGGVKTEGRQRQLDDIKTGKLRVLIATGVLDEGFDVKGGLDMLVMAGSGKSFRLILQRVGRALRKRANGENTSVVLDFYDRSDPTVYRHSEERMAIYENEGFDVSFLN